MVKYRQKTSNIPTPILVIGYSAGCVSHFPILTKEGGEDMSIFEAISLMIAFSILLVSLLSLIIKIIKLNERKK